MIKALIGITNKNFVINRNTISLVILRVTIGLMWLSEGLIKLIDRRPDDSFRDFHFFHQHLQSMADSHPFTFVSDFITNILIANVSWLVWIVIFMEIFIGLSSIFGFLTKIGSLLGIGNGLLLMIITLGWGEWLWTYPLIIMPMVVILISTTNSDTGIDKWLKDRFNNTKIIKIFL